MFVNTVREDLDTRTSNVCVRVNCYITFKVVGVIFTRQFCRGISQISEYWPK